MCSQDGVRGAGVACAFPGVLEHVALGVCRCSWRVENGVRWQSDSDRMSRGSLASRGGPAAANTATLA